MVEKKNPFLFWVMTVNAAGQEWMGWSKRAHLYPDLLKNNPSSIIGLQECSPSSLRVFKQSLPSAFKFIKGEPAGDIYINTMCFNGNQFKQIETGNFWLSDDGTFKKCWGGSERGATWVLLEEKTSTKRLLVVNMHLDNISQTARAEGVKLVLKFIETYDPDLPVVVTADSNMSVDDQFGRWNDEEKRHWGSAEMQKPYTEMLEAGFIDAWRKIYTGDPTRTPPPRPFTYHGFKGPDYCGDGWGTYDTEWIFVRGLDIINTVLIRDSNSGIYPSDHYFMMSLLKFPEDN